MKKTTKILSLEIARILETYSNSEIQEAVELLRGYGKGESLLEYLSAASPDRAPTRRTSSKSKKPSSKPVGSITSRAVLRLKESQPEKFDILSEFDQLVRSGKVLSTNESLRRFGEQLSKGFEPRKSWKESISAVMEVLADLSLEEMRDRIRSVLVDSENPGDDGYQNLANFLIRGKAGE